MTASAELLVNGHELALKGEIDFGNVMALLADALGMVSTLDRVDLDLAGVTQTNSAGLALCAELARQCKAQQKSLRFTSVPERMLTVAGLMGFDNLLQGEGP